MVTGASTGIGRAIALALGRAGYDLAVTDLDAAWLNDLVAESELQGRRVVPIALELRSEESIAGCVAWSESIVMFWSAFRCWERSGL